jgi:hypothetical protein
LPCDGVRYWNSPPSTGEVAKHNYKNIGSKVYQTAKEKKAIYGKEVQWLIRIIILKQT